MHLIRFLIVTFVTFVYASGLIAQIPSKDFEFYENLAKLAADNPAASQKQALEKLRTLAPERNFDEWSQIFLYALDNHKEELAAALQTKEHLLKLRDQAQTLGLVQTVLRFDYAVQALDLENAKDKTTSKATLDENFAKRALQDQHVRFAVQLISQQAMLAYYSGDTKRCLSLIRDAYSLLEKKVAADDRQLLEIKVNMAVYLEFSGEVSKAADIFHEVIAIFRQLGTRWALANALASQGLLLMHESQFKEVQGVLKEIMDIGLALDSPLLQGRAQKSMGYAESRQGHQKPAIAHYLKALSLLSKGREDSVEIADTRRVLADAYTADGQWSNALRELDLAASDAEAMKDPDWERHLQQTRVRALIGLGRTEEALQSSHRTSELLMKMLEEEKQREISRLKISMGLQLEEQKNTMLLEQNRLQKDKLHDADVLRIFVFGLLGLAILVIGLLLFALRQSLRAKRSRERMHRILEHIEEGILSIGVGMKVQADFSPYLKRLLNVAEAKGNDSNLFLSLLNAADLKSDDRATVLAILQNVIGEESLAWDLNSGLLPREISIRGGRKHILLDWQPVYDEKKFIDSVLVTVRDITAQKELQTEVESARKQAHRLEKRFMDILQIDFQQARVFVEEAAQLLQGIRASFAKSDRAACKRHLHTLKGMARTIGFKDMSSMAHDLEDQLLKENDNLDVISQLLDEIDRTNREYTELLNRILVTGKNPPDKRARSLVGLVADSLESVRSMLESSGILLSAIEVIDHIPGWRKEWLDATRVFLLHGLTNSADHGFILPRRRGESVSSEARLTVWARRAQGGMELTLRDNGVGLDWVRLTTLADKLKFLPETGETIADVVFQDGVTTADKVSDSSGRGMGMAAIRQAVRDVSGVVHLKPNIEGSGILLEAFLPDPA